MSMFRAKKLDIGSFVNVKVLRDHTKRKVFAANEPERCASSRPQIISHQHNIVVYHSLAK